MGGGGPGWYIAGGFPEYGTQTDYGSGGGGNSFILGIIGNLAFQI